MGREQVIQDAFAAIDRKLRRTSIAQIGGFRPPEGSVSSWFGGRFIGLPDEAWPGNEDGAMIPLLQVRVDELPHVPEALSGIALFNVFVGPRRLPVDLPAKNGSLWLIRTYTAIDGLRPLGGQPKSHVRPFPVRWTPGESDAPGWEDALDGADLDAFNELPDSIDLFGERYTTVPSTKVGGWPSYIQGAPGSSDGFVFQIASEEKVQWMWGDNGKGYVYFRDGEWALSWDCY